MTSPATAAILAAITLFGAAVDQVVISNRSGCPAARKAAQTLTVAAPVAPVSPTLAVSDVEY